MRSKTIALSAISAGLIAIVLTIGAYVEFVDLFSIVVASVLVLLPLYLKSYLGSFLCYLAGTLIAFLFAGFNIYSLVFPSFLGFFGIYPILKCLLTDKNVNKWIIFFCGLVWCIGAFYGMYFYYVGVMGQIISGLPDWFINGILYFIGAIAVLFYIIYAKFISMFRIFMDKNLGKIVK